SRIRAELGEDTRIVLMLRDPVAAAYSLWRHNTRTAGEDLSFEEALAAEPARLSGEAPVPRGGLPPRYYAYTERVRYAPQVERFLKVFPREQLWIAFYETFFEDPLPEFAELCRFLGVDDTFVPEFRVSNPSGDPRSRVVRDIANRQAWWKAPLKWVLPPTARAMLRHRMNEWNSASPSPSAPSNGGVPPELAALIHERVGDRLQLERTLSRSVPW
ncbi:MAG: hypothetical protein HKN12_00895, partial [Gemmatimonadetes bacterium]|nr:hypothetical protein [Gemmatimonadota bacterium]